MHPVPRPHGVGVRVHQTRQHRLPAGIHHLSVGRTWKLRLHNIVVAHGRDEPVVSHDNAQRPPPVRLRHAGEDNK